MDSVNIINPVLHLWRFTSAVRRDLYRLNKDIHSLLSVQLAHQMQTRDTSSRTGLLITDTIGILQRTIDTITRHNQGIICRDELIRILPLEAEMRDFLLKDNTTEGCVWDEKGFIIPWDEIFDRCLRCPPSPIGCGRMYNGRAPLRPPQDYDYRCPSCKAQLPPQEEKTPIQSIPINTLRTPQEMEDIKLAHVTSIPLATSVRDSAKDLLYMLVKQIRRMESSPHQLETMFLKNLVTRTAAFLQEFPFSPMVVRIVSNEENYLRQLVDTVDGQRRKFTSGVETCADPISITGSGTITG